MTQHDTNRDTRQLLPKRRVLGVLMLAMLGASTGGALWLGAQEIGQLRKEVDALHLDLSRVKPWARDLNALREAASLVAPSRPVAQPTVAEPALATGYEDLDGLVRRYGPAKAAITFELYSDLECSFCASFHPTLKSIVDSSRGNVSLIFKHVPVHGEASRIQALAVECAGQQAGAGAAYRMIDAIYGDTQGGGKGTAQPLTSLATGIGLEGHQFSRCLDSDYYMAKVKSDFEDAVALSISQTPTTVIRNNKTGASTTISGSATVEQVLKAMASVLK